MNEKKKKPGLLLVWTFPDGRTMRQPLAAHEKQLLRQAHAMAASDDPALREVGLRQIDEYTARLTAEVEKKVTQSIKQRDRAKAPRGDAEIKACIARASAAPGTAKEQWPRLRTELENEGFNVRDAQTPKGNPAYEVHTDDGFRLISLGTFQNRRRNKSR